MPVVTFLESNRFDRATVKCEGQVYNFDDRTVLWTPWTVTNLFGVAVSIMQMERLPFATDFRKLISNAGLFQIRNIMEINPLLYTYSLRSNFNIYVTNQIECTGAGGSSFFWSFIVKDGLDGTILMKRTIKYVIVDIKTRKPKTIPDWFQEKYGDREKLHDLPQKMSEKGNINKIPKESYKWKCRIRHSDQDAYMHANQSVYIKLCLDAATNAAIDGELKHYKEDICLYPVEFLDITYIGQSTAEDELIVRVQQDTNDVSLLHFIITKEDKPITHMVCKLSLTKMNPRRIGRL